MPSPADPAVRAILRRAMVVEFATLSEKRRAFVTPLWFVESDGVLYLTTAPGSRVGRNVVQHPQVSLLFHGEPGRPKDPALRVRGTATCHRGLPPWRVLLRIALKYYVGPRALPVELPNARRWGLRMRYYGQGKGGVGYLRVVPREAELLARP
jgi:hypothetical protein